MINIVFVTDDLRLWDNAALAASLATPMPTVAIYIHNNPARKDGEASLWWRRHSLGIFQKKLLEKNVPLLTLHGNVINTLGKLSENVAINCIFANYRTKDSSVQQALTQFSEQSNTKLRTFKSDTLYSAGDLVNKSGEPFKVFTPFWKAFLAQGKIPSVVPKPEAQAPFERPDHIIDGLKPFDLDTPAPKWSTGMQAAWDIGEEAAHQRLEAFLQDGIEGYKNGRDIPGKEYVSRLSPYLRFGEISAPSIWHRVSAFRDSNPGLDTHIDKFLSELGWREFSYSLLAGHPNISTQNLVQRFDDFPWSDNEAGFTAWKKGLTGYPFVDAGMRQLWQTGYMHNRVRMVVASFLVKHLLIHWRRGEEWFWDTLVDADPANNPASWQWVAGCGMDAAPYFRVFNPITQGEKFDPDGSYVRKYVPELANLPNQYIHRPFDAPPLELLSAGIRLGETYPKPIIDHAFARARALEAFDKIKTR